MKKIINLRKLLFIFAGIFFFLAPVKAYAASDYEVSFKFYTTDDATIADMMSDFNMWGMKYSFGMGGTLTEITDLTQLKKDDYLLVAPSLKTIGTASAAGLAFYFTYNEDYLESPITDEAKLKAGILNKTGETIYPNSTFSINSAAAENGNVAITIAPSASAMAPVDATNAMPTSVFLFKLKKDASETDPLAFEWWTPAKPLVDSKGTFASAGSTVDSEEVGFDFVDYVPEVPDSNVKTLKDLVIANGSDKYTNLNWASGSTETSFSSIIPASISSVDLTITPFHSAASIMCTKNCTGSASAGASMTANLTGLAAGTNSIEFMVTAEDGSTQVYSIDIKKLNDDTSLGSVTLTNGISLNYDNATKTYSATGVPYSTASTNISSSVTNNSNAVIDSTGTTWSVTSGAITNALWNLTNSGATPNIGTIKVNAENCDTNYASVPGNTCTTTTYNISVSKNAPKTVATLKSLTVNGDLVTGFVADDATHLEYTIASTSSASITIAGAVTDNSDAKITSGTGSVSLVLGDNTLNVVVIAEDGTTTNTYKIKVKRLSTDATLSGLSITSSPLGTMDPSTFSSSTKSYKYVYDETVSSVNISATAANSNAMVQIGSDSATKGSAIATVTPTDGLTVDVNITAEDGTTDDTYQITFERKKSNVNTLKELHVTDSNNVEYITTFNKDTKEYNIVVENDITSLNVRAVATSDVAKINGGNNVYTGTMNNLGFSNNEHTITVSPEEGTSATYTIKVTRKKSNNAILSDLQVDGVSLTGFDGTRNGTYNLSDVNNNKTYVLINYTKGNDDAKVTITNNGSNITGNTVNLSEGDNVIVVSVKSQDESTTITHTINVHRKTINVNLATLNVTSSPMGTLINNHDNTYTYKYDRSVTSVNITATAENGTPVIGTGLHNISDGDATLTVNPEDSSASVGTYTIKFEQILETDSTLSSLAVSKKDGTPYTLNKVNDTNYTLTVLADIDKVDVSALVNGSYVKEISIDGNITVSPTNITAVSNEVALTSGTNDIEVIVTAEDNTTTIYKITITREINSSAALQDLKVDNVTVPGFNSSTTSYTLNSVDYTKDSIVISATGVSGSTVTGTGTKSLEVGDNRFEVKVDSEDNSNHTTYVINIRRKSNNATITNLVSSSPTVLHNGASNFLYTLDIPSGTNTVSLTPTFATGATLKEPASLENIDVSSISEIKFTVQAEDNTYTNEYTVTLNKLPSTNNNLASLSVDRGTLSPNFASNEINYTVTVDNTVDKINVTATVEDPKSSLTGDGEHSLNYGENTIEIVVTAENHVTKTYTIVVTRNKNDDKSLSSLTIDGTLINGFTATKDTYNITLPYGTTSFVLNAVPTDTKANIDSSELGTKNLTGNSGTFTFVVKAHDGSEKTYTINATVALNSDTAIDTLTVLGKTPTWNEANNRYELTVDGETLKISPSDVVATFTNGASITNKDPEKALALGGNSYKFTVTAADNTPEEVEVYITREAGAINTLDSLTSSVGTLSPSFDKDTNDYELTLPIGTTNFTISAVATSKNPATSITGTGDYSIPVANDLISVLVTSEDGDVNTYEIAVKFEAEPGLNKITSSIHTVNDDYVLIATLELDINVLKTQFDNPVEELFIYESDGTTPITSGNAGTAMVIKLERNGKVLDQKILVVKGDTSGDGISDVTDASQISNHFLEADPELVLTGARLLAGDTSGDGAVDVTDASQIVNYFMFGSFEG